MKVSPEVRTQIMAQAQGAMTLSAAFVGVVNPLFATLARVGCAQRHRRQDIVFLVHVQTVRQPDVMG
jgi:hypothetical protein